MGAIVGNHLDHHVRSFRRADERVLVDIEREFAAKEFHQPLRLGGHRLCRAIRCGRIARRICAIPGTWIGRGFTLMNS